MSPRDEARLAEARWPIDRLAEAVEALARAAGLATAPPSEARSSGGPRVQTKDGREDPAAEARLVEGIAARLGLEAEPVHTRLADAEALVRAAAPALLRVPATPTSPGGYLLVAGRARDASRLLSPTGRGEVRVPAAAVAELLGRRLSAAATDIDVILAEARLEGRARERARAALLRERVGGYTVEAGLLLRPRASAPALRQLGGARFPRRVIALALAHGAAYLLSLLAWFLVGRGALEGQVDRGFLLAWALLLVTQLPLQSTSTWLSGALALDVSAFLKQRLLAGALRLPTDEVRRQGVGGLLGRVLESDAVEALALGGGVQAILGLVELFLAALVLVSGAGGLAHAAALACAVALAIGLALVEYRRRDDWTAARLTMTDELVERMVGHRTRLAQEDPSRWHDGEDRALAETTGRAAAMDRAQVALTAVPRLFLVAGLALLAPAFASGAPGATSPASLAIALGGLFLAHRALGRVASAAQSALGALVAWRRVAPLYHAAAHEETLGVELGAAPAAVDRAAPLVDAEGLVFRYRDRGEPVLRGASIRVHRGDRVLLEGGSGGGKSTLASILCGLRAPETGLLLVDGLDRHALGDAGFRSRVVSAPQFHENHVLSGTLAFNLLMGRAWPPSNADLDEAEKVCRALDLGPLIDRMPSGLQQIVGETGWQLSHGERSRVFMARALLQGAPLVVLDESFAALDPETLRTSLRCAEERSDALLVIAHP